MQLVDQVTLITGAGSGIGAGTARVFAREGARVAVVDVRADAAEQVAAEIRASGGVAAAFTANVADEAEIQTAIEHAVARFGALNVVYANAGINGMLAPIEELTLDEWHATVETNLTGTFLTVKHAIPHLWRAGGGSIITTASLHGTALFSLPGYCAYGSSKAGQIGFVKMAAAELARWKIRVNALLPGGVHTNMPERTFSRDLEAITWDITMPERFPPLTHGYATPEEIGAVALFLASDASRHVTGATIYCDAGISLYR